MLKILTLFISLYSALMKLEEFNKLSFDEKLYTVVDKGIFLDNFITKNIRLNCYAIDKFFVELV